MSADLSDFLKSTSEVTKVLLPLVTAATAALLAFFLNRRSQNEQQRRNIRLAAYSRFIEGVALNATSEKFMDAGKRQESMAMIAGARVSIVLYGSETVIERLYAFLALGGDLSTEAQFKSFAELCLAMRQDGLAEKIGPDIKKLYLILFGKNGL